MTGEEGKSTTNDRRGEESEKGTRSQNSQPVRGSCEQTDRHHVYSKAKDKVEIRISRGSSRASI